MGNSITLTISSQRTLVMSYYLPGQRTLLNDLLPSNELPLKAIMSVLICMNGLIWSGGTSSFHHFIMLVDINRRVKQLLMLTISSSISPTSKIWHWILPWMNLCRRICLCKSHSMVRHPPNFWIPLTPLDPLAKSFSQARQKEFLLDCLAVVSFPRRYYAPNIRRQSPPCSSRKAAWLWWIV